MLEWTGRRSEWRLRSSGWSCRRGEGRAAGSLAGERAEAVGPGRAAQLRGTREGARPEPTGQRRSSASGAAFTRWVAASARGSGVGVGHAAARGGGMLAGQRRVSFTWK